MENAKCRVTLDTPTKRRLWADSGGYCGNPIHAEYLFPDNVDVDFGGLAHIIPASSDGPRGDSDTHMSESGRAHHSNIVILCANCHTTVDKAPESFPAGMMRVWKQERIDSLRIAVGTPTFESRAAARAHIQGWLDSNRMIHTRYGPVGDPYREGNPTLWHRHARATIVPNNRRILRVLEANRNLLTKKEMETLTVYSLHVHHFEDRHVLDDYTTGTERYPGAMEQILLNDPETEMA